MNKWGIERTMINPKVAELIAYMVGEINKRGGVATKTKVFLLLYLFDIEYYRAHRQTFTGFTWVFNDVSLYNMMKGELSTDTPLLDIPNV